MASANTARGEGPTTLRLELEPTREAPALARAAIAGFTEGRELDPATLATIALLVSEIITNAVIHPAVEGPAKIALYAHMTDEAIRIEVTDQGEGFTPAPRDPDSASGGYGLFLVEQEAARWGIERADGNTVWFEIPLNAE
jgi:anti-sigma regulatory factor (Ser/Thr protein kinase)